MESKHCPQSARPGCHEKRPRRRHSGSLSFARWARKGAQDCKLAAAPNDDEQAVRVMEPVD